MLQQEAAAPQVLGASTDNNTPVTDTLTFIDYKVTKGETLFTISQKFGLPTETVAQINDIRPPFNIKAGQTLKIPQ